MHLTSSQEWAITHDGRNLQLIACAGSGKTEVVARWVVHLLTPNRDDSLVPGNIVAFTFTEKAAALKERIVTRTRQALGEINGLAEMFVGTIHAFCLELLKSEVPRYLKYEVLNELSFNDPDEEAVYIVETARSLRGVTFREGEEERGLSWSDMAVFLRSVRANPEPITTALYDAGIPFVVTGMTNLFATPEAETALTDPDQKRWGLYSIQRVFLNFLEQAEAREERVPDGHGEVVFYNLGKFSQLISDFETIHYHSEPVAKYAAFADFLQYRAQDAYPEDWQDNQYANPDAVRIMTVHQAKGMHRS